jgi:aspartyl protease family protein
MHIATTFSMITAVAGIACAWAAEPGETGAGAAWPPPSAHVARMASMQSAPGSDQLGSSRGQRLRRSDDGLFYVTARVNGVPVRFLVDTGATMVVLTPADARRIGIAANAASVTQHMETAAGSSEVRSLVLGSVEVAGRGVDHVEAAIIERGLGVSLLGQNLLSRLGPITLSGDELHFG